MAEAKSTAKKPTSTTTRKRTTAKWEPIGHTDPPVKGPKVREAQQLLNNNKFGNFRAGPVDGVAGNLFAHATHDAKYWLGYPLNQLTPIFGQTLYGLLKGTLKLNPQNLERRHNRQEQAKDHPSVRDNMVKWCEWGIAHEGEIHYAPVRPINFPPQGHLPLTTDCSGSSILFAKWAGVPAHGALQYNGAGSSYSLAAGLRHVSWADAQNGDYVCWPAHHIAVIIDKAHSMLESHGMERGPLKISLADEAAYHRGQGHGEPVFLSLV